ncbi:MAG: hypothetical protein ACRDG4_03775, partial [Chloroflexota bacterium]
MINRTNRRPRLLYLTIVLTLALLAMLGVVLYGAISDAAKGSMIAPTQAAASTGAQAIGGSIANNGQLVATLAGQTGIIPILQG